MGAWDPFNPSPANGATEVSLTTTYTWLNSAIDASPEVWICKPKTPDPPTRTPEDYPTELSSDAEAYGQVTLLNDTHYHWGIRNRSYDLYNGYGIWDFWTPRYPASFTTIAPADAAVGQSVNPTLSWNASTYATSYKVSVGVSPSDSDVMNSVDIGDNTSYQLEGLTKGETYKWKIQAINSPGTDDGENPFNDEGAQSFTVVDDPTKPDTPNPINAATGRSTDQTLGWADGGSGNNAATSYDVYFGSSQSDVTNGEAGVFKGNQAELTYDPELTLDYGQLYYWRIDAKNDASTTTGDVWSFTVESAAQGTPEAKGYAKKFVSIAGNSVYYEDDESPPNMILLSGLTLDTTKELQAFEAYQKLCIVNDDKKKIVDFANTKLTCAAAFDAGAYEVPTQGMILTDSGSATMIVDHVKNGDPYEIYGRTTSGTFGELVATGTNSQNGSVSFTIASVTEPTIPHYYDWEPNATATGSLGERQYGSMPAFATLGCLYRGRAMLGGNSSYPNQWYGSRQANIFDFLYFDDDLQTAVAGTPTEVGELGDLLRAFIPYKDDYWIIGCASSIWLLRGDPVNGSLDQLSFTTGIFSAESWCWDDVGNLYIFGTNGIYMLPPGFGQVVNLTRDKLPTFVSDLNLNPETQRVSMGFDQRRSGLVITVTNLSDGSNQNFWFDLRTQGFFPETYPDACGAYSLYYYDADQPNMRKLMVGCKDGHIRTFEDDFKSDDIGLVLAPDTTAIESKVMLGPRQIGVDEDRVGVMTSMTVITGGGAVGGSQPDSDDIDYDIVVADTAGEVIEKVNESPIDSRHSGTIAAPGRDRRIRQRTRGAFMAVVLSNDTLDETWAAEKVVADIKPGGKIK